MTSCTFCTFNAVNKGKHHETKGKKEDKKMIIAKGVRELIST